MLWTMKRNFRTLSSEEYSEIMNVRAVTDIVDLRRAPGDIVIFRLEICAVLKSLSTKGLGGAPTSIYLQALC